VGIGRSSLLPKPDTKNLAAYGGAEGEAAGEGRSMGDIGEMQGRYRGDIGEI
jgi:hypothetical protein